MTNSRYPDIIAIIPHFANLKSRHRTFWPVSFFYRNTRNLSLLRLHSWEGQDFSNAVVVCQEHDHAINTHAKATGWRQSVLEGTAESLVYHLSLVITLGLLAGLLFESQALFRRDVQLGIPSSWSAGSYCAHDAPNLRVNNLLLADERLESLAKARSRARALGKRGHHQRVAYEC